MFPIPALVHPARRTTKSTAAAVATTAKTSLQNNNNNCRRRRSSLLLFPLVVSLQLLSLLVWNTKCCSAFSSTTSLLSSTTTSLLQQRQHQQHHHHFFATFASRTRNAQLLKHTTQAPSIPSSSSLLYSNLNDKNNDIDCEERAKSVGDNNNEDDDDDDDCVIINSRKIQRSVEPQVFPQRWVQLAYLSALALLSDWICFSVAAVPDMYESAFAGHSAANLIDMFLFTNVASCFLVTDVVAKIGLQRAIQGSAVFMALGCWLRSGFSFLPLLPGNAHLMAYPFVVAGTIFVGAAQPFFQCTPPLLSALWFRADERATSTAVALNFNQIGIATAFLVGGIMVTDRQGLENYFGLIAVLCTLVAAGTLLQFENEPPVPPSASELEKKLKGVKEPPFLESVQLFFRKKGFTQALAAFVCSITITNIVGAFIEEVMQRGGITSQFEIDLAGAGFELAILVGGIIIGGYVDKTKEYKKITMLCLAATCFFVIPLGLTEHAVGKEPLLLILSLLGLGMAAGPIQPINAELAVDVTYPGDETAVESVQQIGGNLVSALLVPIVELASKRDYQLLPSIPWAASDIRGDVVLMLTIAMLTMSYFNQFDAPLSRSEADEVDSDVEDVSEQGPPLKLLVDGTSTSSTTTTKAAEIVATTTTTEK